jgi:Raf kinase inhibitor-like YbhB/YbcL family protein
LSPRRTGDLAASIAQALERHADSLMAVPGVVGVAEGRCAGTPCIKVLVARRTPELARRIPATLEGHRVEIHETGEFRAFAQETAMGITLTSTAFREGAPIPVKHTCDGPDVSPPLAWRGAPAAAKSFALVSDDPDAPGKTWVHWVLYNVPPTVSQLAEGDSGGGVQGLNDFRRTGYGGPCPPPGKPHRYFFKLYSLDAPLALTAGATKADVERAMQGHVLAQAQLIGTYGRQR